MGIGPVPAVRKLLDARRRRRRRHRSRRAERGVRVAGLAVDPRARPRPGARQRQRRRDRARPPARLSGARLVVTLLHELRRRGGRYGLATLCVGVGQGQAALCHASVRSEHRPCRSGADASVAWIRSPPTSSSACAWAATSTGSSTRYYGPAEIAERVAAGSPSELPGSRCGRRRRCARPSPATASTHAARAGSTGRPAGSRRSPAGSPARRSRSRTRWSAATGYGRGAFPRRCSRPPTAPSRSCCLAPGPLRGAVRRLARGRRARGRPAVPARGGAGGAELRDAPPGALGLPRGRGRSSSTTCATSRGRRSTTTRAGSVAAWPSTPTCPSPANRAVHIVAHETYPGHHTEHAWKEQRLVREGGFLEESLLMIGTPQATIGGRHRRGRPRAAARRGACERVGAAHLAGVGVPL